MKDYADVHYMKTVQKINEMISAEDRDFHMILNIRNEMADIRKDIDELKRALSNQY